MRRLLILLLAACLVATAFVIGEIASRFAASDRYSTYRGGGDGAKALYLTLQALGLDPVRVFESPRSFPDDPLRVFAPARSSLPDGLLFVLLDAGDCSRVSPVRAEAWLEWVQRGNTLVLAHSAPMPALLDLLDVDVDWPADPQGRRADRAVAPVPVPHGDPLPAVGASAHATMRRPGRYRLGNGNYAVLLGTGEAPTAVAIPHSEGWVVLVSDPFVFSNAGLRETGNLELALGLGRHRGFGRIAFDEEIHGFAASRSIVGYLRRRGLDAALLQAVAAAAVAVLAWRGRRVREPRPAERSGPGSRDFLDAMARIYAGAGFSGSAASELSAGLVGDAARALGLSRDRPPAEVLPALDGLDRVLQADVAAAVERGCAAGFSGRGRNPALVGYYNHTLALGERLLAAARGLGPRRNGGRRARS